MTIDPFYFGSADAPLFGVVDHADGDGGRGVVVCAPIGYENVIYYRQLWVLARRLAAAGRPTIRFDWPGTGDSYGDDDSDDLIARSIEAVGNAAVVLAERTGVTVVDVVGLRFGATLAAASASTSPLLGDLVLWDPFPTGRSYLRAVRAFERLSRGQYVPEAVDGQTASGFVLPPATVRDVEAIDLTKADFGPPRRVLLAGRDGPPSEALVARFEELGHEVTSAAFEGLREAAVSWTERPVPVESFAAIEAWLQSGETARRTSTSGVPVMPTTAAGSGWEEELVLLADGNPLLGVATVPDQVDASAPWLLFLPNGYARRIGPNGLYRRWARVWAAEGLPSFRVDVHGLGDAGGPDEERDRELYRRDGVDDVRRAVAFLRARYGATRIATLGLCSGGQLGFHAALAEDVIDDVFLLNTPMLVWSDEEAALLRGDVLLRRAGRLANWRVLLRNPRMIATTVLPAARRSFLASARRFLARGAGGLRGAAQPALKDWIRAASSKLEARNCHLHFVFSEGDAGISYLNRQLGAGMTGLADRPHVSFDLIADADHTFRDPARQRELRDVVATRLRKRGYLHAEPPVAVSRGT